MNTGSAQSLVCFGFESGALSPAPSILGFTDPQHGITMKLAKLGKLVNYLIWTPTSSLVPNLESRPWRGSFCLNTRTSARISHSSINLWCSSLVVEIWLMKPLRAVLGPLSQLSSGFSYWNPWRTQNVELCSKEGVPNGKSLGREKDMRAEGYKVGTISVANARHRQVAFYAPELMIPTHIPTLRNPTMPPCVLSMLTSK